MSDNGIPSWKLENVRYGTMVRTALWLIQEVGLGNVFTKEQHRSAFADITQADRRLRDLRPHGWIIHTSAEDLTLNQNEQRLVAIGTAVWDSTARRVVGSPKLTQKQRMEVFAKSDYQCVVCGIAGGEKYPDLGGATAVLSAIRRTVVNVDKEEIIYRAECKLCSAGSFNKVEDVSLFLAKLRLLNEENSSAIRKIILELPEGALHELWREFRNMSAASRCQIRDALI